MKTLSLDDLSNVTGGKNLGGKGSSTDDQLLTTLQGIQSSLADLGKNQNQGLFGGTNGLVFMTMALALTRRNSEVVVCGGKGCRRGGFAWRVW